jgi:hypothetical protein
MMQAERNFWGVIPFEWKTENTEEKTWNGGGKAQRQRCRNFDEECAQLENVDTRTLRA